jgi:dihydrofolate synthase/folylpolyglutamate synthase
MDILGDTLSKIAFEKAGIIKPNIPVIIGEFTPETKIVFQKKSTETQSQIFFAEEKYKINSINFDETHLEIEIGNRKTNRKESYQLDLNGLYQQKNLLAILCAIEILKNDFVLEDKNIRIALGNVKKITGLHGRWEVIHQKPLVVLDVAHNVDGFKQLIQQIFKIKYDQLRVIFGMVKDKDIQKVLEILPENATYYFTKAQIPRALPEKELQQKASQHQLSGTSFPDVNKALKSAISEASEKDMIIVCGSVFVVGEVSFVF